MKTTRLTFVRGSVGVCVAGVLSAGCGGDDDDGGGGGTGACTSSISANHGHTLTISAADKMAGAAKTYDIAGSSQHSHTVAIDADDFADLASGTILIVTSSTDAGHSHDVEIKC